MRSCCPKYRIYDKQDNAMYAVTSIVWAEDGESIRSVGANGRTYEFTEDGENWPVMQAIGLRDKHGRDIYESDRVNVNKPWITPRIETVEIYTAGGMVGIRPFTDTEHQWTAYTAEIVGNIHQNPELVDK